MIERAHRVVTDATPPLCSINRVNERSVSELRAQCVGVGFHSLHRFIFHEAEASNFVRIRGQSYGRFGVRAIEVDPDFVQQDEVRIAQCGFSAHTVIYL